MRKMLAMLLLGAMFVLIVVGNYACGKSPVAPKNAAKESVASTLPDASSPPTTGIGKPGVSIQATRTTGYQAYRTDWQWDWKGPHFTIHVYIPHSTYSISRFAGIPTSCCEGGLNNWLSSRQNLGNGWDDYVLVIPKTLRLQYGYLTDWEFSRFFWIWCTYNA